MSGIHKTSRVAALASVVAASAVVFGGVAQAVDKHGADGKPGDGHVYCKVTMWAHANAYQCYGAEGSAGGGTSYNY